MNSALEGGPLTANGNRFHINVHVGPRVPPDPGSSCSTSCEVDGGEATAAPRKMNGLDAAKRPVIVEVLREEQHLRKAAKKLGISREALRRLIIVCDIKRNEWKFKRRVPRSTQKISDLIHAVQENVIRDIIRSNSIIESHLNER